MPTLCPTFSHLSFEASFTDLPYVVCQYRVPEEVVSKEKQVEREGKGKMKQLELQEPCGALRGEFDRLMKWCKWSRRVSLVCVVVAFISIPLEMYAIGAVVMVCVGLPSLVLSIVLAFRAIGVVAQLRRSKKHK